MFRSCATLGKSQLSYYVSSSLKSVLCAALASMAMLTGSAFAGAPANDAFASAIALTGSPVTTTGDNTLATADVGQPAFLGSTSVWYTWTAPSAGTAVVSTAGSSFDTRLGVYTGSAVNALTQVNNGSGQNNDYGSGTSQVIFVATAGTVYQIGVSGNPADSGPFNLGISLVTSPPNDNLANAIDLGSVATFSVSGDTTFATREASEASFTGAGRSIWYKWTAPAIGSYQFNTNGSTVNLGVTFYTGTTFPLTQAPGTGNINYSQLNVATAGTVYFIQVEAQATGTPSNTGGPITLNLAKAPANDNFTNAINLGNVSSFTAVGDNTGATQETAEPPVGDSLSIWYKWTSPMTGVVLFDNSTSDNSTSAVYSMFTAMGAVPPFTNLTYVNDVFANQVNNTSGALSVPVTTGTVYYFQESSSSGRPGKLALTLAAKPANDDFANAIDLGNVASFSVAGTTAGATFEAAENANVNIVQNGILSTVWYKWTSPSTRQVTIDTNGGSISTAIGIYTGTTLANLVNVTTSSDSVTLNVTAATVYWIQIDGNNSRDKGTFLLNLKAPPANDNFANALAVTPTPKTISGNNTNATLETMEPQISANTGGASVWYSYTPTAAGLVTINYYSTGNQPMNLAVYTGTAVNALTLVTQTPIVNFQSSVTFQATAGTKYSFKFDTTNGTFTTFQFQIVLPPANDNFANRTTVTGSAFTVAGTTVGATIEAFEPSSQGEGKSVWYSWTATSTGTMALALSNSANSDQFIDIFTGSTIGTLTKVASGLRSVSFKTVAGTVYQIRVDDDFNGGSAFILSLIALPPNDNFANAITLMGSTFDVSGYNIGATLEAGEPLNGTDVNNSVWYSWTAPANLHVTVTLNSDYGSSLQIFTGTSVSALSKIKTDQQGVFNFAYTFNAVAGTVYNFQVGGDGSVGTFELTLYTPPVNDNFANAITLTGSVATANGNIFAATNETGEPVHNFASDGHSVWYKWTAPAAGAVTAKITNSNFSDVLAVYTGSAVNALTRISSGTGSAPFTAVAGTTYFLAVDSNQSAAGTFTLLVAQAPVNDNFVNAIALSGTLPITTAGSNIGATYEAGEPLNAGVSNGQSVWWSYSAVASGVIEVSTAGSSFDSTLGIYTGSIVSALTLVGNNNDVNSGTLTSTVQFNATAGTTYYISVDGSNFTGPTTGAISLTINASLDGSSPLTASISTPDVGQPTTFTVGNNGPATYAWNFGDGSTITTTTGTVTHVYTTAGTYTVTVVATQSNGTTVTNTLSITVRPVRNVSPSKNSISLAFTGKAGTDSISLSGLIPLNGATLSGPITINIGGQPNMTGGLVNTFTLTDGKFKTKTQTVTIGKPKAGTGNAKFTISYKGSFQATFAPLGFTKPVVKNKPVVIPLQIVFNGISNEFTYNLLYTSTTKKGTAK